MDDQTPLSTTRAPAGARRTEPEVDIQTYLDRAHVLRSQAVGAHAAALWRAVRGLFRAEKTTPARARRV